MQTLKIANHLPNRQKCGISTYAKKLYAQTNRLNLENKADHNHEKPKDKIEIQLYPFDTKFKDLFKATFKKLDVIHFQHEFGIWPWFGLSFLIYLVSTRIIFEFPYLFSRKKFVVTMHTVWDTSKIDRIFVHYPTFLRYFVKIYLKLNYFIITNFSHKVLVLSQESIDILNQFSINKNKVEYLPHGVLLPEESNVSFNVLSADYNLNQEDKLIVMFGFAYPSKGFHLVLEALPNILKDVPEAKVIMACSEPSDGGQNYLESLKNLALKLNIQDKVIFTGFLEDSDPKLLAIFKYSSCFVYPYFERGGGSGSIATVFAYNKPILVSNINFFQNYNFLPRFKECEVNSLTLQLVKLLCENRDSKFFKLYLQNIKEYVDKYSIYQSFQSQIKIFTNLFNKP